MEDLAAWHRVERWVLTALGSGNGGAQQPKAWRRGRHFVLWAPAPSSPRARNPFPPSAGSLPASSFFLHPGFTAAKTRSSAQSQQVGGTCRNPLSQPSIKATRHGPTFRTTHSSPLRLLTKLSLKPKAGSSAEGSSLKNFKNILRTESSVEKGQGTFSGQHSMQ